MHPRFLLHVLPRGFHRIRHYGLLASGGRRDNLARARELLAAPLPPLHRTSRPKRRITSRLAHAAAAA